MIPVTGNLFTECGVSRSYLWRTYDITRQPYPKLGHFKVPISLMAADLLGGLLLHFETENQLKKSKSNNPERGIGRLTYIVSCPLSTGPSTSPGRYL